MMVRNKEDMKTVMETRKGSASNMAVARSMHDVVCSINYLSYVKLQIKYF